MCSCTKSRLLGTHRTLLAHKRRRTCLNSNTPCAVFTCRQRLQAHTQHQQKIINDSNLQWQRACPAQSGTWRKPEETRSDCNMVKHKARSLKAIETHLPHATVQSKHKNEQTATATHPKLSLGTHHTLAWRSRNVLHISPKLLEL
jgi:hypothetical protein